MSLKLYEIKEEFLRLAETELDEQTMYDTLESLEFDLAEKVDSIACIIKSLEAEETALNNEVDKLLMRAKNKAKKADNLKQYLFSTLKQLDKSKFETTRNVLSIKKNPVSVILDEGFNESKYMIEKVSYTADKATIKQALQNGEVITGARLEQKERLEVK